MCGDGQEGGEDAGGVRLWEVGCQEYECLGDRGAAEDVLDERGE